MKIHEIFRFLCELYDKEPLAGFENYLIPARNNRETLLLRSAEGVLEMALSIDASIIEILESGNCLDHPDELSCATEGVSHLFYAADRANRNLTVSMLELELQGEVDKFLLIHLMASARSAAVPLRYFIGQFENFSLDKDLTPAEIERYNTASHFAAKYCAFLYGRYFNPLRRTELIANARDFYERNFAAKLERLIP